MRRREFIKFFFLGTIGWPRAAMAQRSGHPPSIAVLTPYEKAGKNVFTPISRGAFDQALRALSWIDGQNIRIEYRDAGGDLGQLRNIAQESVKLHPDLIVAVNTPLVAAVLDETHTIPVVFGLVSDPIGSGFVQSLARPGGNATGFAYGDPRLRANGLNCSRKSRP